MEKKALCTQGSACALGLCVMSCAQLCAQPCAQPCALGLCAWLVRSACALGLCAGVVRLVRLRGAGLCVWRGACAFMSKSFVFCLVRPLCGCPRRSGHIMRPCFSGPCLSVSLSLCLSVSPSLRQTRRLTPRQTPRQTPRLTPVRHWRGCASGGGVQQVRGGGTAPF